MPPLTLLVKPASGLCNMRCRYCFYVDEMDNRAHGCGGLMDLATAEALVRRAFIYADGWVSFMFQGGEPTLAGIDFYRQFIKLVDRYNARGLEVRYALQTNGFSLDEAWAALFREHGFLVGVSMDGTRAVHDLHRIDARGEPTFNRIKGTLDMLLAHGVEANVLCVVTEPLARKARDAWQALAPYGYVQFIPCLDALDGAASPWSLTEEGYALFLNETFALYAQAIAQGRYVSVRTFDNWIGMLRGYPPDTCAMRGRCVCGFTIESDGSTYPCDFYALDAWHLGNIREVSLVRMMKSEAAKRFIDASLPIPDACTACAFYPLCRNGCRRERIDGLNRFCGAYQDFFGKNVEELQRLARTEIRTH